MARRSKISIVTVSYNSADTIQDTLTSVVRQTYGSIEYIVVDGGSTDGTQSLVGQYNGGVQQFVSEPDNGIYDAMNKGIQMAQGDVIGFLNADDLYVDEAVISDIAEAAEEAEAVYGDLLYVRREDVNKVVRYWKAGEYLPGAFRLGWVPPHPTFFCRRSVLEKFGSFDPLYRIAGDFELMLRLIEKHKVSVSYVPRPLVRMRVGGRANTLRGMLRGNREILRAFAVNGIRPSPSLFLRRPLTKLSQLRQRPAEVTSGETVG